MEASHSKRIKLTTQLERGDGSSSSGQPQRGARGFDGVILKVAEALSDDGDIRRLGLELGVKNPDINRALETNWAGGVKTSNGNVVMLQNWAMTVESSKLLPTLRAALKKAGLLEVEETCFFSSPKGKHDVVPDEILRLKEKLKSRYRKKYSEVKTSPIDPESRTWLQHIYVSLVLMIGSTQEEKEPIDYDGLFQFIKTETEKGFPTRLSFIGEAGVGKSTLFAKIALDWAEGNILQDIDLLMLESFREIENSKFFGDIVMNHFPDDTEIKGERVDEYIRKHQRKVLILLDGLDEAKIDIKKSNRNSSVVSIVRGERFIDTPVLITTRPHGADQIKNVETIRDQYTFIEVQGFSPENRSKYINQYFKDDRDSASTLIEFVKATDAVAKHMAPIPIFCCMLCYMWKKPSTRESVLKMETLPQLLERLVFSLQEHYCSKDSDVEGTYVDRMHKAARSMRGVGMVAFEGLLEKQLIFDEEAIESEVGMIACEVGILSKEKRLAPMKHRERHKKPFIQEFSFPHKLLQEYTSSFYLASLFDDNRPEFNRILTDKLLKDYEEFRYVWYFTAARGGDVGMALLEALCLNVDDVYFIMKVAYECHDTGDTMEPIRNRLNMTSDLILNRYDHYYFFTLETLGKEIMRKESLAVEQSDSGISFESRASSSYTAAVGLITLQNLQTLEIWSLDDEDFYRGMCNAASASKIQTLSITGIAVTRRILHAILSLPHLQSLDLRYAQIVDADDEQTLSLPSSPVLELDVNGKHVTSLWKLGLHTSCSQVEKLTLQWHEWGKDEDVSSDIVSMACSPFKLLNKLYIEGGMLGSVTLEPVSFCNAVITSCPLLTKLYIRHVKLYNEKAAEIIQSMKKHPHLIDIELRKCQTNEDLDPLIAEVNREGKLTVTVGHGPIQDIGEPKQRRVTLTNTISLRFELSHSNVHKLILPLDDSMLFHGRSEMKEAQ